MNVTVKCFAMIRDITGMGEFSINLPNNSTVEELLNHLVVRYSALVEWKQYLRIAVNREYVTNDKTLHENDVVALIPPVSGG